MNFCKISIVLILPALLLGSCIKDDNADNTQLTGQWTFVSTTGVFPSHPSIDYRQVYSSADHMVFGLNDTIYTNQIELAPYNNDTAFYTIVTNNVNVFLFTRDSTQNGTLFKYVNG